jgi:hypothetical protein
MAQAQVTIKVTPYELQLIVMALKVYASVLERKHAGEDIFHHQAVKLIDDNWKRQSLAVKEIIRGMDLR